MSRFVRFIAFYSFFMSLAFGQTFRHKMQGTIVIDPTRAPVSFTLSWNESAGQIQGQYHDNYFAGKNPVTGINGTLGRNFTVVFPQVSQGIKQLQIQTTGDATPTGLQSVSLSLIDAVGAPLNSSTTMAEMTTYTAGGNGTAICSTGFGALTGYCGLYSGSVTEASDPSNRCNLIGPGVPRLELNPSTEVNFYLNYQPTTSNNPFHAISRLQFAPTTASLNQMENTCGPLVGTTFLENTCKNLRLTGNFVEDQFNGTYTLRDMTNGEFCSYNLSLRREITY